MKVQNGTIQQDYEVAEMPVSMVLAEAAVKDQTGGIPENHARHLIEDGYTMTSFETEVLNVYTVRLVKGQLGLTQVQAAWKVERR